MALKKTTTKKKTTQRTAATRPTSKRETATKGPVAKKAGVAPARPKPIPAKPKPIVERQTKLQIVQTIAEETGLERKQVESVFGSLDGLVRRHMQKRGSGEFTVPDVGVKIRRARQPSRKARKGRNPATGEEITIPAKRAHDVIRLSALKALKDTLS